MSFNLHVYIPFSGDFATTAHVQITLTDINDNHPIFYPRNYSKNIRDDTARNEEIITVQASDLDSGDYGKVTYSIIAGNDEGRFTIDPDKGMLNNNNGIGNNLQYFGTIISYDFGDIFNI